jgi:ADP-heptose:LPS heptosyltransferase
MIDALGKPLRPLFAPRRETRDIARILVMEPWLIGDSVIATSALVALRHLYPSAHITVLGKAHARELLEHSGLADDVIVADLPWTARTAKYDPRRYDAARMKALFSELRRRNFDLTVDARMDLRSNVVTYATRAPRRIGYDFGGGAFLLTDAVAADPDAHHRVDDWLALLKPLGLLADNREFPPTLRVSEEERRAAVLRLGALGIRPGDRVIGVHGGASDARRRWPIASFARVAETLAQRHGAKVFYFLDPDTDESSLPPGAPSVRTSLREMMALLAACDLVLCNDSGPMHIADALDVPVVGVFLTGNPVWHRPYRSWQKTVGAGTGHDFQTAPTEADVLRAAEEQLARPPALDYAR